MRTVIWFLVLAVPPWVAVEFDAPKWVTLLAIAPFFLFAMTREDPDEDLLGEASSGFRKGALVFVGAGGLFLAAVLFILWQVFFPAPGN